MTDKKENERRLDCPIAEFKDAYVILPKYWLGEHCIKRDEAIQAAKEYKSVEVSNFSISLHLVDEFVNIPGMKDNDLKDSPLDQTPLVIISWLSEVVLNDFLLAYNVPKNS